VGFFLGLFGDFGIFHFGNLGFFWDFLGVLELFWKARTWDLFGNFWGFWDMFWICFGFCFGILWTSPSLLL